MLCGKKVRNNKILSSRGSLWTSWNRKCDRGNVWLFTHHISRQATYMNTHQYFTSAVTCKGFGWSGYICLSVEYIASSPRGVGTVGAGIAVGIGIPQYPDMMIASNQLLVLNLEELIYLPNEDRPLLSNLAFPNFNKTRMRNGSVSLKSEQAWRA